MILVIIKGAVDYRYKSVLLARPRSMDQASVNLGTGIGRRADLPDISPASLGELILRPLLQRLALIVDCASLHERKYKLLISIPVNY